MASLKPAADVLRFERSRSPRVVSAASLRRSLQALHGGESIVVLANREPFRHERAADARLDVRRSSGGLVTALEPIVRACSGVWVAHGAGTADRAVVDARDGVAVPPANPRYRLRRVWLDADEERGYYFGFANEGLWPLCHRTAVLPIYRSADFAQYQIVNARFAAAACEEATSHRPLMLVQDYHLALAPAAIRDRLPLSTIVAFWHIPWPDPVVFASCPWARRLLRGLLGSTIVGFQTADDCANFLDCVDAMVDADVDRSRGIVTHAGRSTAVRAYPISVEWPSPWTRDAPTIDDCRTRVRQELGVAADAQLVVGVDRLDYTKGLAEKFRAVERLLVSCPEMRGRFVFVQIAEPSRESLQPYRELRTTLHATVENINARFGARSYQPLILREARHEPPEVYRLFRAADVCYVGSLHDGMNLVAKEFVAARDDERGVLVLSQFAGAARELAPAIIVNPYAIESCARALRLALHMPVEEQCVRMRAMRATVARNNAYTWATAMLVDAAQLRASAPVVPMRHSPRHVVGLHA
jgi:trehalose 6-phosphate synthase